MSTARGLRVPARKRHLSQGLARIEVPLLTHETDGYQACITYQLLRCDPKDNAQ